MSHLRLVGFRYSPAIGGAENYARRLLQQIGTRLDIDVATVLTTNRADWLRALIEGERDAPETYSVDGRSVTAISRWPLSTRRRLRLLAPLYHAPMSPVPGEIGRLLAPHMAELTAGTDILHNVFMGRESFSLGVMLAAHRARLPFVFTPLRHQRLLGWNSPAFHTLYREADAVIALTEGEAAWLEREGAPRDRLRVIGLGPQNDPEASPRVPTRCAVRIRRPRCAEQLAALPSRGAECPLAGRGGQRYARFTPVRLHRPLRAVVAREFRQRRH